MSFLYSCNNPKNTKEYKELDKLNSELRNKVVKLNLKIDSLENTPERQYLNAKELLKSGKKTTARNYFSNIVENFEDSEFSKKAKYEIKKIDKAIKEEKRKIELKKTLGFRILKPSSIIKIENLTLKFSSIQFKKSFTFDSYGDRYFYRTAERGSKYITARVSVSSEVKDPKLPHILAYRLKDGKLENLTGLGMEYRFRRWDDYGSYLGNEADYKNDFARTKTIPFSLGYEISESEFKGYPTYIVLHKTPSLSREYKRFDNPPVKYNPDSYSFKRTLTVDDFDKDGDYILIKKL